MDNPEHLPVLKGACWDGQEQNARTIHASNPEHLLVFKAPCGDDLKQNAETIQRPIRNTSLFLRLHASNPEHLLVFKASRGMIRNRMRGRSPCPIRNTSLRWGGEGVSMRGLETDHVTLCPGTKSWVPKTHF